MLLCTLNCSLHFSMCAKTTKQGKGKQRFVACHFAKKTRQHLSCRSTSTFIFRAAAVMSRFPVEGVFLLKGGQTTPFTNFCFHFTSSPQQHTRTAPVNLATLGFLHLLQPPFHLQLQVWLHKRIWRLDLFSFPFQFSLLVVPLVRVCVLVRYLAPHLPFFPFLASRPERQYQLLFSEWTHKHSKSYHHEDFFNRYNIWKENLKFIEK